MIQTPKMTLDKKNLEKIIQANALTPLRSIDT